MTCGSLFSGIGGFELGLLQSSLISEVKWQVEIDDFCNKILEKHWPDVKRYKDIRDVGKHNLEPVELICGGFPCQPFSVAGKRKGKEDDRYLWYEMFRVITEMHPAWVIGENVPGIINMALDEVLSDLESEGYETATFIIPACAVNAPHRRDRVWIIAYSDSTRNRTNENGLNENRQTENERWEKQSFDRSNGQDNDAQNPHDNGMRRRNNGDSGRDECSLQVERPDSDVTDTDSKHSKEYQRGNQFRQEGREGTSGRSIYEPLWEENWIEVATCLCRVDDGIPNRVDRLKCLGNAIVPQVVCAIGTIIKNWIENETQTKRVG